MRLWVKRLSRVFPQPKACKWPSWFRKRPCSRPWPPSLPRGGLLRALRPFRPLLLRLPLRCSPERLRRHPPLNRPPLSRLPLKRLRSQRAPDLRPVELRDLDRQAASRRPAKDKPCPANSRLQPRVRLKRPLRWRPGKPVSRRPPAPSPRRRPAASHRRPRCLLSTQVVRGPCRHLPQRRARPVNRQSQMPGSPAGRERRMPGLLRCRAQPCRRGRQRRAVPVKPVLPIRLRQAARCRQPVHSQPVCRQLVHSRALKARPELPRSPSKALRVSLVLSVRRAPRHRAQRHRAQLPPDLQPVRRPQTSREPSARLPPPGEVPLLLPHRPHPHRGHHRVRFQAEQQARELPRRSALRV